VKAVQVPVTRVTPQVRVRSATGWDDAAIGRLRGVDRQAAQPGLSVVAIGLVAAFGALLATGLETLAFAIALAAAVRGLRRVAAAVTFSFTDGFLSFRADDGWPTGVQEDDDFHWSWSPRQTMAGTFPPPRARGRVG
jgi:hypothetical protein